MSELHDIEVSIDAAKEFIAMKDAVLKLKNNPEFKKVFLHEFFQENVVRLVKLKATPHAQNEKYQTEIMQQLDAVGQVDQFLTKILVLGDQAHSAMLQAEEERDILLNNGGN